MNNAHIWPIDTQLKNGVMQLGGCSVLSLVEAHGTPLYVFDEQTVRAACQQYVSAFQPYSASVAFHYASKAMLNVALAKLLLGEGFGFDVVSLGELQLAQYAGAAPAQLHLHGNAKPRHELETAVSQKISRIAVDNLDELRTLIDITNMLEQPQKIMLRVEPAVAAATHSKIQTGQRGSKFGLSLTQIDSFVELVKKSQFVELVGLHFHLGSQLFEVGDYEMAVAVLLDLMAQLRDAYGIIISEISPGGGLAAAYLPEDTPPDPTLLANIIIDTIVSGCQKRNLELPTLIIEPGRSIVARAGVALYRVIGSKPIEVTEGNTAVRYLHVDGGMGDNLRPALYGAKYTAVLANRADAPDTETIHIAGRFCESGDMLLKNGRLPHAQVGDLVAFATAGGYTLSMANNYNLVPRPAVVMVNDGQATLTQRRETFTDLIARDVS